MKLDDWKARLRAPEILLPPPPAAPLLRPSVVRVLDGPPSVPPLNLLVKPESLLQDGPGLNASFKKFVTLEDRDHDLLASIGHDAPLIAIEVDHDILADQHTLRFRLTNQSHHTMLLPVKYRPGSRGAMSGELPSVQMLIRPYREPSFNELLGRTTDIDDEMLASWAAKDAVQFGAWPEGTRAAYHRLNRQQLSVTLQTADGASASFTIAINGDKLSITIPPFLGAIVRLSTRDFHGR